MIDKKILDTKRTTSPNRPRCEKYIHFKVYLGVKNDLVLSSSTHRLTNNLSDAVLPNSRLSIPTADVIGGKREGPELAENFAARSTTPPPNMFSKSVTQLMSDELPTAAAEQYSPQPDMDESRRLSG